MIGLVPEIVVRIKVWIQCWYHFVTTLLLDFTCKAQEIKIQRMYGSLSCWSSYFHISNIVFSHDSFLIGYPHSTPPLQMKRMK